MNFFYPIPIQPTPCYPRPSTHSITIRTSTVPAPRSEVARRTYSGLLLPPTYRNAPTADEMRDSLGLIQYDKGIPLVELTIPSDRLEPCRWARPTFADGGINRRFRFRPDGQRRSPHSDWGSTVHLALFADGHSSIDGVPECVVSPVPFDNELHATVRFLGTITKTRGDIPRDNDNAFANRLLRGRPLHDSLDPLFT
jgi:hypothetical protein